MRSILNDIKNSGVLWLLLIAIVAAALIAFFGADFAKRFLDSRITHTIMGVYYTVTIMFSYMYFVNRLKQ